MSDYMILLDKKRNCTIRTTSMEVVNQLKKDYPTLLLILNIHGRNCSVSAGKDMVCYTQTEYKKLREEEKKKKDEDKLNKKLFRMTKDLD